MKIKPNAIPTHAPALPQELAIALTSSSQYSQGATIGGPLKISWPPEILSPRGTDIPVGVPFSLGSSQHPALPATLVFEPKTKDAHMLTKKVSTFEKSERFRL